MPADVAAALDEAIASRAASEPPESPRSQPSASKREPTPRRTPWVLIGGAAAAAVVVLGSIGLGGSTGCSRSDDSAGGDAGSAADSRADSLRRTGVAAPDEDDAPGDGLQSLAPAKPLDARARCQRFATQAGRQAASDSRTNRTAATSAARRSVRPDAAECRVATPRSLWEGEPAVVVVDPTDRTATVFGCGTGSEPLYSTSY